jgi:hypothetical protein
MPCGLSPNSPRRTTRFTGSHVFLRFTPIRVSDVPFCGHSAMRGRHVVAQAMMGEIGIMRRPRLNPCLLTAGVEGVAPATLFFTSIRVSDVPFCGNVALYENPIASYHRIHRPKRPGLRVEYSRNSAQIAIPDPVSGSHVFLRFTPIRVSDIPGA